MKLMRVFMSVLAAALCMGTVVSADADFPEMQSVPELYLDSQNRYLYMPQSYAQGYVPTVQGGYAVVVVPLRCDAEKLPASLRVSAMMDVSDGSPFVTKNYEQTVSHVQNAVNDGADSIDSYHIVFWLALKADRINGSYPVTVHAEGSGVQHDSTVYVCIADGKDPNAVTTAPAVTEPEVQLMPKLLLDSYDTGGEITAGEQLHLRVTLRNTSETQALQNLTVTAAAPADVFDAMQQSPTLFFPQTAAGGTVDAEYDFRVLPNVPAGQYQITLRYDFAAASGMTGSGDAAVTVAVVQPLKMKFPAVAFPAEVTVTDTVQVPVQAINLSLADAKNVYAELSGNGFLPQGTAYFGDMAAGTEMTLMLPVQITSKSGSDSLYGQTECTFTFHYSDMNGEEYTEIQTFSVSLRSPFTAASQTEDAVSPRYWIAAVAALAAAALALTVYLILRFRRRRAV